MTATDELRRMLDERGVHWLAGEDERKTLWESNGLTWEYFNDENGYAWFGFLGACEQDVTPAQAIAATLGSGTLTADDVRDLIERHSDASGGNGCDFHNGAYAAIADELNATLGVSDATDERHGVAETCKADETERIWCRYKGWLHDRFLTVHVMECSACGGTYEHVNGSYEFCPRCGRRVVE